MTIQEELLEGLRELREEFSNDIISIKFTDGTVGTVEAIVYNLDTEGFQGSTPVIVNSIMCNILKQDLIDKDLPIKGMVQITWNRDKYEVIQRPISTWGVVVTVELKKVGI